MVISYSGDGFLAVGTPGPTGEGPANLGGCCRLALRVCALAGFLPGIAASIGARPSLMASLPSDKMDKDLPWPFAGLEPLPRTPGCEIEFVWECVPLLPPREDPLTTFSDNVGRCPLPRNTPCVLAAVEGARDTILGANEDCLLCDANPVLSFEIPPLDVSALSVPAGRAMFRNSMIHSSSSPAYTVGCLKCT